MSASSLWVTCGTFSQARCRMRPGQLLDARQRPGLDRAELGEVLRPGSPGCRCRRRALRRRGGRCRPAGHAEQVVLGDPALRPGPVTSVPGRRRAPAPAGARSGRRGRRRSPARRWVARPARRRRAPPAGAPPRRTPRRRRDRLGRCSAAGLLLVDQRRRLGQRAVAAVEHQDRRALADLVADLDQHLRDRAAGGSRHVHRRLVGLQRDQRVLGVDRVAVRRGPR